MKDLLLPFMFDNGQAIRDGEEIGRLSAKNRNLSRQRDELQEALAHSQQATQTYSELAESYSKIAEITQRQLDKLQDLYNNMLEDPLGLQYWVQCSLRDMRSRLVRATISKERLLAMKGEEGITAAERREMNKALVSFAYVLWDGMTRFMRLYVEAEESLRVLRDRLERDEIIPIEELMLILGDAIRDMSLAQSLRLPSWPGIRNSSGTKPTLRERTLQAQQTLKEEMDGDGIYKGGEVIFEPNGNRLIPGPTNFATWKGGIRAMLEENWGYIMNRQFE